jgi:serine protease Do
MKVWTTAAATLTVLVSLAIGAAMAPVARGQAKTKIWTHDDSPASIVQFLAGGAQIGVSVRDLDAEDAKKLKLANVGGVLIEDVQEDSPASKAGMKEGDVVVEFDGERVRSTRQFTRLVQETPVDRQVQTIVMRDGQRVTLSVQPGAADAFRAFSRFGDLHMFPTPPDPPSPPKPPLPLDVFPRFERYFSGGGGRIGMTVDSLSDQLAGYFGTKEGVLVSSVRDDSAAAKAGVKAGDVITGLNGGVVRTPSDLSRRMERLEDGDEFTLDVVRDKKPIVLKGKVEPPRQPRRWTSRTIL